MMMRLLAGLVLSCVVAPVCAQWQSVGQLKIPEYHYTFLATTPQGDLLAGTYNRSDTEIELPALLIKHPTSESPEVVELSRLPFPVGRGFGGIACDEKGFFFVSGDTGSQDTSFVSKFTPAGKPELTFGTAGVVLPGRRCLGVEVIGNYLLMAVDWGEIMVLRADTGARIGLVPAAEKNLYIRDIAVDPRSLRIFGVARGGIHTWGNAAPWNPTAYVHREIDKPTISAPLMGEGITLDPFLRCVVIAPPTDGMVREVFGDGRVVKSPVTTATDRSSLTDVALSFDGTELFVSDYTQRTIHVLRREAPAVARPRADDYVYQGTAAPPGAVVSSAPTVEWSTSMTETRDKARAAGKSMLVYFEIPTVKNCASFEKAIIDGDEFRRGAAKLACVREDASKNPLLARSYGVFIVPSVILFDRNGNVASEHRHPIDTARLLDEVEKLAGP